MSDMTDVYKDLGCWGMQGYGGGAGDGVQADGAVRDETREPASRQHL